MADLIFDKQISKIIFKDLDFPLFNECLNFLPYNRRKYGLLASQKFEINIFKSMRFMTFKDMLLFSKSLCFCCIVPFEFIIVTTPWPGVHLTDFS